MHVFECTSAEGCPCACDRICVCAQVCAHGCVCVCVSSEAKSSFIKDKSAPKCQRLMDMAPSSLSPRCDHPQKLIKNNE